jgi:hypothetical protein
MRALLLTLVLAVVVLQEAVSFQSHDISPLNLRATTCSRCRRAINGERFSSDESTNYNYIGLNTNRNAPYVPSGLNPEQYEKIKQIEAAKLARMNFGAWGPRFKPETQAPNGDWMVQTSLWVQGFQAGGASGMASPVSKEDMERFDKQQRYLNGLKMALSSLLLGYAVLDILMFSFNHVRATSSTKKVVLAILAKQGILQALRQHLLSSFLIFSKLQLMKVALAGTATPLINQYREIANRRWLWSKRRTFGTPILGAVAFVIVNVGLSTLLL